MKARVEFYQGGTQRIDTGWVNSYDTSAKEDDYNMSSLSNWEMYISVQSDDGSVIVPAGRDFVLEIPSVFVYMYRDTSGSSILYEPTKFNTSIISVAAYDANGNNYELTDADISGKYRSGTGALSIKIISSSIDADIVSFTVRTSSFSMSKWFNYASGYNYRLWVGLSPLSGPIATVTSEEAGLLKNIINQISELPDIISDKIKSLFVPSEDSLASLSDRFNEIMSSHFGAVYQCISLFTELGREIGEQTEEQDSVLMPEITLQLAGSNFTFGGYEVSLVPERFRFIVDILKGLIALVCTLLFVNMLKHRYLEVVSK